jgi:hypothetical protein
MDDEICCDICLENFNSNDKTPKIVECCSNSFCLKCLNEIYKKNSNKVLCPICRKTTNINPVDLNIDKIKLEPKTSCPSCKKCIKSKDLKIKITKEGMAVILCSICFNERDSQNLKDYLENLAEETEFLLSTFSSYNIENFDSNLDLIVTSHIDHITNSLRQALKTRVKQQILDLIQEEYKININNLGVMNQIFDQIKKQHIVLKTYSNKDIKNSDYAILKNSIDFYISKSEILRKNGLSLKKAFDNINSEKLVTLDENFEKLNNIETFLSNLLTFNINKNSINYFRKCDENAMILNTGLSFIDNKLFILRQENEKLNRMIWKKESEFHKLEKHLNNLNLNNSTLNQNSLQNINQSKKFETKCLYMQNFNFSLTRIFNNFNGFTNQGFNQINQSNINYFNQMSNSQFNNFNNINSNGSTMLPEYNSGTINTMNSSRLSSYNNQSNIDYNSSQQYSIYPNFN